MIAGSAKWHPIAFAFPGDNFYEIGGTDDVLGQNRGKVPRHAKKYADFASEYDRLQAMRVKAMGRFVAEVHEGDYPAPQYLVDCESSVVEAFRDWLDRTPQSAP